MKTLTKVERKMLEDCHPNAGDTVFDTAVEQQAIDALLKCGLVRLRKSKGRYNSLYYLATKAGRALLKQLKGSR